MSKTPEQTVVDTSQDPSLGYIKAREVSNLISSENGIITTQTNKGYVVNTLENVTRVISKVVETNVSADWSAEEGPTAILNKPNLDVYTTQADIDDAIANLVNSAPGALNTLSELANALGNNASYASSITNQLAEKADLTYVNDALANISDISVGNIEFNDTTLGVVGGNLVKDITIVTGDNKQFVFGADGTLTIPDVIQSAVNGVPKFTSASDIILEAVNRVKVQGASFKLASKTNGQRQLLLPQAGDMIYNTTVNAVQVYTGSVWVSLGSGGSGSGLEEGTISDLAVGLGIHILGATPTANTAAGEVLIEGGYDLSESGGPNAKGGTITLAAGQGANDVDAAHGGDIYIYSGPASQYAGNIRIEGGGTYGASGKAGDILLQSGSSLSGVAGNITIQSGVGSGGMQIFEGALKLRGANVDVTSSFESVKIKTGDVDFNDPEGPSVWEFDNVGVMHLPTGDSSIVSTAGNVTISGHDVPANGSGATGAVFIRGGIDYTNNPLTQDRVYINNTYIQGTTLGQEDSTANLNLYSVGGMELTTAGGGMKLEVGPSMFGYGEDMTIVAGNGGGEGAQSSDGGDLILSAGNGGFNAEGQPEARGGNVYLSSGGGLGGSGSVIIEAGPETWTFDGANLKLPAGGDIVDSNGTSVLSGGVSSYNDLTDKPFSVSGANLTATGSVTTPQGYSFQTANGYSLSTGIRGQTSDVQDTMLIAQNRFAIYTNNVQASTWQYKSWTFMENGNLIFPDATTQSTAWTGSVAAGSVTGLATVATSGSYNDLADTPTAPSDGASAYEVAVAGGFVGDEAAWLASLVGATGAKGDQGIQGSTGAQGATGAKGDKGDTGDQGVSVTLQGTKATIGDLPVTGNAGDGWIVTTGDGLTHLNGSLWFWNVTDSAWNDIGPIVGPQGDQGAQGPTGSEGAQGPAGADGLDGAPGADGADGQGVSLGGTTGQVLAKIDGTDFNTQWITLPTTGNITFSDTVLTSTGNVVITFDPVASPAVAFSFTETGVFNAPQIIAGGVTTQHVNMGNVVHVSNDTSVICPINVDTVIYTGTGATQHTFKALLLVEGVEDPMVLVTDTQSCEMMIAKGFKNDSVAGTVYGLVYTSTNPLATFSTRWNAGLSRVEVLCRPTSTTNSVNVRSFVTEITTND